MRRTIAIACAILLLGCSQLLSSDSYRFVESTSDSGADSSLDGGGAACQLARPPAPVVTQETGGNVELIFAIRTINIGETTGIDGVPEYRKLGFDLDGRCTSAGDPPRCTDAHRSDPSEGDGINGIDDALGHMISTIKSTFGQEIITSKLVNDEVQAATLPPTSLFRIRGYDGLDSDNHVEVDWYFPVLPGPTQADGGGAQADAAMAPRWDGTDVWPVQPSTFVQPPSPDGTNPGGAVLQRTSVDAYVSRYQVVATFPQGIPFRFWHLQVALYDPMLTIDIVPNPATGKFELRGLVTGRAKMSDVMGLVPTMTSSFPGIIVCTNDALYVNIRNWMCSFFDLSSSSSATNPECDMMSVALGFEAAPVRIGAAVDEPQPPRLCPPETDPINERCQFTATALP